MFWKPALRAAASGLGADRTQQEGRKVRLGIVAAVAGMLAAALRTHVVEAGDRRRGRLASRRSAPALAAAILAPFLAWHIRLGFCGAPPGPADGLAGELLDRGHRLAIRPCHDRDRGAGAARAAGAADAMDVVVGMMRHI